MWEFLSFGLEYSFPISAIHGIGIDILKNEILQFINLKKHKNYENKNNLMLKNFQLQKNNIDPYASLKIYPQVGINNDFIKLAIVGRPNVGKSTLLNTISNEKRVLTSSISGTTTDPILMDINWLGTDFKIMDTAGIRRNSKIKKGLEKLSVSKTVQVIKFAEVVIMLVDTDDAFNSQDLKIINHIEEEGRSLILALNKWDLENNKREKMYNLKNTVKLSLPQFGDISIITISAKKNEGITKLNSAILAAKKNWIKRIPTSKLNKWLEIKTLENPPPLLKGKRIKLRYITQIKSRPPNFLIFSSTKDVPKNYQKYLFNSIRSQFNFLNVPIRLSFRTGKNPYVSC